MIVFTDNFYVGIVHLLVQLQLTTPNKKKREYKMILKKDKWNKQKGNNQTHTYHEYNFTYLLTSNIYANIKYIKVY